MKKLFNFGDFIKESVDESGLVTYTFSFPVKKRYQLKDDGTWTWDEICEYLRRNGTDLRSDVENNMELEEGEEREVTDDDIDNYVNKYNMRRGPSGRMVSGGWQDFKNDYGLDFEDDHLEMEDYRRMMGDFNEGDLEQYFDFDNYEGEPFELYNLRLIEPRRGRFDGAQGTFQTNIELNEEQIKSIKDYITGQCSDGWGEGFEQQSEEEEMDGLNFETSLHPWSSENWYIKISKPQR